MVLSRVDEKEEIGVALVRPHPGSIQSHFRCGRADVNGVHKLLVNLNNVDQCLPAIRCGGRMLVLVSRDIELNICGAASSCGLGDCGIVLGKNRRRIEEWLVWSSHCSSMPMVSRFQSYDPNRLLAKSSDGCGDENSSQKLDARGAELVPLAISSRTALEVRTVHVGTGSDFTGNATYQMG
jgi:hypothetical protein